ncbi:GINS complex, Sld5 component [Polychaeton citri CBS 116435]|uniref:DNA replication complex GINS protein SLD5 n=1 Tax=Polychaeton citri CBS 116435 TaxID=1314669 RepID=A0A9P4UR75_9PEZI|nr:GINS complex, Sld5 component [Polychaeton citri CBS 116435]
MDDIDDILASVSRPQTSQRALDLQALTRGWINERASPDLLPYPSSLLDRVMERLKKQIEAIEEMTGTMDPKSNFTLVITQTELERFKFLVRSLLRARIVKIDKFPLHYRSLVSERPDLLSTVEQQYLTSHQALLSNHFNASFLQHFPQSLRRLDDTAGGNGMVDKPDEDTAVFCRVLRDVVQPIEVHGEVGANEVELKRGDVWVLRWSSIRDLVKTGDVEMV